MAGDSLHAPYSAGSKRLSIWPSGHLKAATCIDKHMSISAVGKHGRIYCTGAAARHLATLSILDGAIQQGTKLQELLDPCL